MRKIFSLIFSLVLITNVNAAEKLSIEKQLVGVVGAISGKVQTETRELKVGDKIYLNETILAGANSGTQILLLDQSTFTIGSESEVIMDTFVFDPSSNDGKIVASVKQGSLKIISGLISKKNPDNLTVKVPEGTLGSRGTEFQTIVSKKNKRTDTLLIGPGKNNTLGLRPGAVLVGNKFGNTLLNKPYSVASMTKGKAPGKAQKITDKQLKKFKKRMKALKVAKLEGVSKDERKAIKKKIRQDLKEVGLGKEEIKTLIKDNIKKDKEKKIIIKKERLENENKKVLIKQEATESGKTIDTKKVINKDGPTVTDKTITRKDGTVIQERTVINRETGKVVKTQKITKPDGTVVNRKKEGQLKKKKVKKVVEKKKPKKKEKAKNKNKKKKKAVKKKKKIKKKKKAVKKKKKIKKKKKGLKNNKKKKKSKAKPKKKKPKKKAKPKPKKKKPKVKKPPKRKKVVKKRVVKKKKKKINKRRRKK